MRQTEPTRRSCTATLGTAALTLAGLLAASGCTTDLAVEEHGAALRGGATLIVRGGTIVTGNPRHPTAEAMAIRGERIVAVGSERTINKLAGHGTEFIDLAGQAALPGFVDSHAHYGQDSFPMHFLFAMNPEKADVLGILASEVGNNPELPLVLAGWLPTVYTGTREELDAISAERPIIVWSLDYHGMWMNSAAIAYGGIPEPADEPLYRGAALREDGTYDGSFLDFRWTFHVLKHVLDQTDPEVLRANILGELQVAAAQGVTSIVNLSLAEPPMRALVDLALSGELPVRVREAYDGNDPRTVAFAHDLPRGIDRNWFDIIGAKYFLDGAPWTGTAAYAPGTTAFTGPLWMTTEELRDKILEAAALDEQVLVHSTGHDASHLALDALDAAGGAACGTRFRIEHADAFYPEDLERLDGVVTSLQPAHFPPFAPPVPDGLIPSADQYGQLRYLDAGATVVLGSDDTVPPTIWLAMSMIGTGPPEEGFTFDQALAATTSSAAYATFDEDRRGMLRAGMLADFTVVDRDPRELSPDEMFGLQVTRTVVGGRTQFLAE